MSTTTPKLGLIKPDGGDYVDVNDLNTNFDKIDGMTATDVGALPISGGTLSGNSIEFYDGYGSVYIDTTGVQILTYDNNSADKSNNRNKLAIFNNAHSSELATKVRFETRVNGTNASYRIFGEHNKSLLTEEMKDVPISNSVIAGDFKYYKTADGTVHVEGTPNVTSGTYATYVVVGTLPVGYRPKNYTAFFPVIQEQDTVVSFGKVDQYNGQIELRILKTHTATRSYVLNFSFKSL